MLVKDILLLIANSFIIKLYIYLNHKNFTFCLPQWISKISVNYINYFSYSYKPQNLFPSKNFCNIQYVTM